MALPNIRKAFLDKYVILVLFVLLFYSISHHFKWNLVSLQADRLGNALWFYYAMLYISLPILTFVAFYRLIFVGRNSNDPYMADGQDVFEDLFEQNTPLDDGFSGQLLLYEKYLFIQLKRLQSKTKRTERRGIAFASSAAIFPFMTYLLVSSVALSNNLYGNLPTLTVANLTIATICVSAGVTLINLSKKIGQEASTVRSEISEIMKMRIVLSNAAPEEVDEIRKKVQLRLIKTDVAESSKQDENVDAPTIVGFLKNLSSSK